MREDVPHGPFARRVALRQLRVAEREVLERLRTGAFQLAQVLVDVYSSTSRSVQENPGTTRSGSITHASRTPASILNPVSWLKTAPRRLASTNAPSRIRSLAATRP